MFVRDWARMTLNAYLRERKQKARRIEIVDSSLHGNRCRNSALIICFHAFIGYFSSSVYVFYM